MRLTTQQAADLLGISRPTLVSLVESGVIPFERQSSHRKLLLSDVLQYREKRKAAQYEALGAIYDNEDESPEEMLHRLSEARRVVAARRAKEPERRRILDADVCRSPRHVRPLAEPSTRLSPLTRC